MSDSEFPYATTSRDEEIIMRTSSEIIASLAEALANVETGEDSKLLLEHMTRHSDLVVRYSEKLIQCKRLDIRSVK